MKISLGPIQYFWPAQQVYSFYEQVKTWPVDIIYLGENVCAKRRELKLDDWIRIADELTAAGKQVILSTMVLIEADSELSRLKRICENRNYKIEANDLSAVYILNGIKRFVAGPHINIYNVNTLNLLFELGIYRWVMPIELSAQALEKILADKPDELETEVFAYGHIPLSFSARCFTARMHNLPKDQCDFLCKHDHQGISLYTQEQNKLFNINGIQLQSGVPCNLIEAVEQMQVLGVDVVRLSPQANGMQTVVEMFQGAINKTISKNVIESWTSEHAHGNQWCNGYWYGQAGMDWQPQNNVKVDFSVETPVNTVK